MRKLIVTFTSLIALFSLFSFQTAAQQRWKYFTADDFAARRSKIMEKIGDGVAFLQGAELPEAFVKFRQDNNFYYLTGVEVPGAYLVIDGKYKKSMLFVPDRTSGDIKEEAIIKPGRDEEKYKISNVISTEWLPHTIQNLAETNRTFFLVSTPEETAEMSRDRCVSLRIERMKDPFDGRVSKEANFHKKLKDQFPSITIKDLAPTLDLMRWVKDEKEIAAIRDCGTIGALGFDEAMRVTKPGIYEYQVVAACDFIYANEGAQGPAYFAIAASGERGLSWHYNANNHIMKSGDVILMDYAPENHYYTTDITRTWPVNGKFTDIQLKMYNCIKEAEENVIAAMKPGVTENDLKKVAKAAYVKHGFEKLWPDYIGHFVGMAVHDVGPYDQPFVPGVVFNVEPIIEDRGMKIHLRLEDTIVITATGSENLTKKSPLEVEAIYKLIKEKGIGEK
jgi:Xaa-Pro aminopeptidase